MKQLTTVTMILAVFLTACAPIIPVSGGGGGEATPVVITAEVSTAIAEPINPFGIVVPFPTPEPPTAIPTLPSAALSLTELKYKILDQFPDFFFCDPDFYPVAHDDEMFLALQRFSELQANQDEFQAILNHNGLSGATTFTDEQKLLIYREYKKLSAIHFQLSGDKYQFQIRTGTEDKQGYNITGAIDGNGVIEVQQREQGFAMCPICLTAGTLIDTPRGAVRVENVRVGDQVWTRNEAGERVAAIILKTGSVRVPAAHQVIHIRLDDGRELWASPGHPTADSRRMVDLGIGDVLDGAQVIMLERVPYQGTATYDLLPSGGTGFYWANGILIGSTLKQP